MMRHTPETERRRIIRASEVGAYVYCARAWWLGSVEHRRPDDVRPLQAGWATHERHGRQVLLGAGLARLSALLLLLAGLAGLAWLVSGLLG